MAVSRGSSVTELAGVDARLEDRLDPFARTSRRRSRNCSARSPVSAGNSCRKTQT